MLRNYSEINASPCREILTFYTKVTKKTMAKMDINFSSISL